jgi:RNA-binding protein YhbY
VEKAERHALAEALVKATNAGLAGEIGRMVLLYRRHPNKPKIALPRR